MRRDTFKLLIFAAVVGFAVLYGMELSSKGIENVNGPWDNRTLSTIGQASADEGDWTLPAQTKNPTASKLPVLDRGEEIIIPRPNREPIVDRVSDKTANVLHDLSRHGIRLVVSIFDSLTG